MLGRLENVKLARQLTVSVYKLGKFIFLYNSLQHPLDISDINVSYLRFIPLQTSSYIKNPISSYENL